MLRYGLDRSKTSISRQAQRGTEGRAGGDPTAISYSAKRTVNRLTQAQTAEVAEPVSFLRSTPAGTDRPG